MCAKLNSKTPLSFTQDLRVLRKHYRNKCHVYITKHTQKLNVDMLTKHPLDFYGLLITTECLFHFRIQVVIWSYPESSGFGQWTRPSRDAPASEDCGDWCMLMEIDINLHQHNSIADWPGFYFNCHQLAIGVNWQMLSIGDWLTLLCHLPPLHLFHSFVSIWRLLNRKSSLNIQAHKFLH